MILRNPGLNMKKLLYNCRSCRLQGAIYYGRPVDLVGRFINVKVEDGQPMGIFQVTGTKDEALLRSLSGKPDRLLSVHLCAEECPATLTEEFLVHGKVYLEVESRELPWYTNLVVVEPERQAEDELAKLREEEKRRAEEMGRGEDRPPKPAKKEKKAERKEKKAREPEVVDKRRRSDSDEELEVGQKAPRLIFVKTGLDPEAKQRRQFLRKARKLGRSKKSKKKKSRSSHSSTTSASSSSSSGEFMDNVGLFDSEKKLKSIWKRFPGALACSAATEAKQQLLTASGTVWGLDRRKVDPVFTHYARQCLMNQMSPPMAQETLTIAQGLDLLLQGHVAGACDLLAQRMKSLESSSKGCHWTVSRQMELIKSDGASMAEEGEAHDAAKRAREEEKLRALTSRTSGARPHEIGGQGKGGKRGKDWKGASKGKQDEGNRGKGGAKKGEHKEWEKKDKWGLQGPTPAPKESWAPIHPPLHQWLC